MGMNGTCLEQGASSTNMELWHFQEGWILSGLGQVVSACEREAKQIYYCAMDISFLQIIPLD